MEAMNLHLKSKSHARLCCFTAWVVLCLLAASTSEPLSDDCFGSFNTTMVHQLFGVVPCRLFCNLTKPIRDFCQKNCPDFVRCVVDTIYEPCEGFDKQIWILKNRTSCMQTCVNDQNGIECQQSCKELFSCFKENGWMHVIANNESCIGAADQEIDHGTGGRVKCIDVCQPFKSLDQHQAYCKKNCKKYSQCVVDLIVLPCQKYEKYVDKKNATNKCSATCVSHPTDEICQRECSEMKDCLQARCQDLHVGGFCNALNSTTQENELTNNISSTMEPASPHPSSENWIIILAVVGIVFLLLLGICIILIVVGRKFCPESWKFMCGIISCQSGTDNQQQQPGNIPDHNRQLRLAEVNEERTTGLNMNEEARSFITPPQQHVNIPVFDRQPQPNEETAMGLSLKEDDPRESTQRQDVENEAASTETQYLVEESQQQQQRELQLIN